MTRDPEMMERARNALAAFIDNVSDKRGIKERLTDFAAAEVRRALVEELERLERLIYMDDGFAIRTRLRELRSSQGDASQPPEGAMRGETEHQESRHGRRDDAAPLNKSGDCGADLRQSPASCPDTSRPGAATVADSTEQRAQGSAEVAGSTPAPGTTCYWSQPSEDSDLWEGSCGVAWSLNDGTPGENGMGYCPQCGKLLAWDESIPSEVPPPDIEQSEVAAGSRAPERVENAQADLPAPASSRHDKPGSPATDEALAPKETLRQPGGADLEAVGSERLTRGSPALSPWQADMDALSKACRLVAERAGGAGWLMPNTVEALLHRAEHLEYLLRAASAKPAPEPRDGGCS